MHIDIHIYVMYKLGPETLVIEITFATVKCPCYMNPVIIDNKLLVQKIILFQVPFIAFHSFMVGVIPLLHQGGAVE